MNSSIAGPRSAVLSGPAVLSGSNEPQSTLAKPSRVRQWGWPLAFALSASVAGLAYAGGGGQAAEHDHWSVVSTLLPGLHENLQNVFGQTWIAKDAAPGRTAHAVMAAFAALLAIGLGVAASRKLRNPEDAVVPETKLSPFTFFEIVVGAVLGTMEGMMGREKARATFPVVGAVAVYILFANLLGMVPGFLPPTDNLNATVPLGVCVFVLTHYYGVKYNGLAYFGHFFGPIRAWYALPLMLLMFVIELISHLVRPVSLGLRLMGNMYGDHTVLAIFLGFNIIFVPLPVMVLGFMVCVVQTLVFTLLTMVYFSMAVEDVSHH